MKNAYITGIVTTIILMAGCSKQSPNGSATPVATQAKAASSTPVAQPPERAIVTKAGSIVLPEFKLDGVSLQEAVYQLRLATQQNDPESKGVNFVITDPAKAAAMPKITLALKNVTIAVATERLADVAGVHVSALDYAFVFDPK